MEDLGIGGNLVLKWMLQKWNLWALTWLMWLRGKWRAIGKAVINFVWRSSPQWATAASFTRFIDHTQRHPTVGRTVDEGTTPSQRPLPDNTQHSQQTDRHAPGEIRTYNLSRRVAPDLRPRGHWDRQLIS